jgi:CheY-like chemotaxis protein
MDEHLQFDDGTNPPLRVAVIDDEPMIRSLFKAILERQGHRVETHENASDSPFCSATTCPCSLHPNCPDVIVSDINMPGMDGISLLLHLHQKGCKCRHVALMTGYGISHPDLIRVEKFGTRVFIKPHAFSEIVAWLKEVKAGRSHPAPAMDPPPPKAS